MYANKGKGPKNNNSWSPTQDQNQDQEHKHEHEHEQEESECKLPILKTYHKPTSSQTIITDMFYSKRRALPSAFPRREPGKRNDQEAYNKGRGRLNEGGHRILQR